MSRVCQILVILSVLLCMCSEARANSGNRIALVGLAPEHALTRQLDAELGTLKFEVVLSDAPIKSWRELRDLARRLKVAAAVWITGVDRQAIEIWVVDLVTGKTVQRSIQREASARDSSSRVLAMRVIELLRASFREIAMSSRPPRESEVKPSTEVRAMAVNHEIEVQQRVMTDDTDTMRAANTASSRLSLVIGSGPGYSIGGVAPAIQIAGGVNWLVEYPWGIAARVQTSAGGITESGDNGSAELYIGNIAFGAYALLTDYDSRWRSEIGIAVAWIAAYMEGKALEPYESKNAFASSFALFTRLALVYLASENLGVRLELSTGRVVEPLVVRFAEHDQATWGKLYCGALLALDIEV
ncbi:MAG: hypothetical protein JXA30_22880 [Deltaproteobacteria bacterium]|nr:hypothetical protein [Deltaproteobacteria bacterium]